MSTIIRLYKMLYLLNRSMILAGIICAFIITWLYIAINLSILTTFINEYLSCMIIIEPAELNIIAGCIMIMIFMVGFIPIDRLDTACVSYLNRIDVWIRRDWDNPNGIALLYNPL